MRSFLVAAVAMALGVSRAQTCDPIFECRFHYQTASHLWVYDFTSSCTSGYTGHWQDASRQDSMEYFFELCGTVGEVCYQGTVSSGSAIQKFTSGGNERCEVIGHGAPLYSPWGGASQVSDAPPPGINVTFLGQAASVLDPNECGLVGDVRATRSINFQIACDPTVDGIYIHPVGGIVEGPTCTYNAFARSKWGCATRYSGPDSSTAPTGDPNQVIGLDGGTAFGCVVGGAVLAFVVWAGIGYARTGKFPCVSGGGSAASSGFATGKSSTPAATPSFGGTSGVGSGSGYGQVA